MALEVVWLLTALVILATVCLGVFKGILGDSVPFSKGPRDFLLDRLARYGDPFTITLMGKTYTVINSPETIKFVLSTAHASFPTAYPEQYKQLLGMKQIAGERHPYFRRILLSAASGEGLQRLLPFINSLAEKTVRNWESQAEVNLVDELSKFAFYVAVHLSWRDIEPGSKEMEHMTNEICIVAGGLAALPINLPGFAYHKALKAKQVLISLIQNEISRRRKAGIQQDDALNALMSITEIDIPDYDICSITMGIMFAAFASSGALIPFVLKYLDNFPEVRQRVQEEQDCVQQKMIEDKSLTWFKPKSSMPYTLQVIYEIIRIEFFNTFPRQANTNIDYNGLNFRKGSYVWVAATCLHFDPKYHPNPWEFDPSRFAEKPKPNTFLPFGQGAHLCPGSDLALTEAMLIIHHLITKYRWEKCGPDGIAQFPVRRLVNYPIHLVKRSIA